MNRVQMIAARNAAELPVWLDPTVPLTALFMVVGGHCRVHPKRIVEFRIMAYTEACLVMALSGLSKAGVS